MRTAFSSGGAAEAVRYITNEIVDELTCSGTSEGCRARIGGRRAAGMAVPILFIGAAANPTGTRASAGSDARWLGIPLARRHPAGHMFMPILGHASSYEWPSKEGGCVAATIPPGFQQLLREPSYCEIASVMLDGSPHIAQVWVDTDGEHVLINTRQKSQKVRNIRRDPRVAVNVFDPSNQWRLGNVRGKVVDVTCTK